METLKFVMTAAFYPPYHLGGDANHVRYLAEALEAQGDVPHVPDDLREAAAVVALPARWAQALRRPRRRDRPERFPARHDRSVSPGSRRPHPELRARSEPVGPSEFSG